MKTIYLTSRPMLIRSILLTAAIVGYVTFQATRWSVQAEYMKDVKLAMNLPNKGQ